MSRDDAVEYVVSLSTAEMEQERLHAFESGADDASKRSGAMPPGQYRLIDGQVYRVLSGTPFDRGNPA